MNLPTLPLFNPKITWRLHIFLIILLCLWGAPVVFDLGFLIEGFSIIDIKTYLSMTWLIPLLLIIADRMVVYLGSVDDILEDGDPTMGDD